MALVNLPDGKEEIVANAIKRVWHGADDDTDIVVVNKYVRNHLKALVHSYRREEAANEVVEADL